MHNDCRDIVMFKENPVFLCFSLYKYSFVSLQTIQTSIENPAGSPCTFLYKSTILRIFTSYNFRIVIQINLQRSILYNEVLCTTPCGIEYCTSITVLFQMGAEILHKNLLSSPGLPFRFRLTIISQVIFNFFCDKSA